MEIAIMVTYIRPFAAHDPNVRVPTPLTDHPSHEGSHWRVASSAAGSRPCVTRAATPAGVCADPNVDSVGRVRARPPAAVHTHARIGPRHVAHHRGERVHAAARGGVRRATGRRRELR